MFDYEQMASIVRGAIDDMAVSVNVHPPDRLAYTEAEAASRPASHLVARPEKKVRMMGLEPMTYGLKVHRGVYKCPAKMDCRFHFCRIFGALS